MVELAGTPSFIFESCKISHFNVKYPEIFCITRSVKAGEKYTEIGVSTNMLPER